MGIRWLLVAAAGVAALVLAVILVGWPVVLREPGLAPALASGLSFKEPMQGSQLKQMGILKPWSATRSYGLVLRCDERMQPVERSSSPRAARRSAT